MSEKLNESNYVGLGIKMLWSLKKLSEDNPEREIFMVSGPISTGGKGNVKDNLIFFAESIKEFQEKGYLIFDQMPFEDMLHEIREKRIKNNRFKHYDWTLLEECYLPLITSECLKGMIFLPDYYSSIGARWEYDKCLHYNKIIKHY